MFDQQEFKDFERQIFEDPEDMLDRVDEKLQEAILSYVLWCKTFCEWEDSPEIKQELLDRVKEDFDFFERYLMVRIEDPEDGVIKIYSSIRRSAREIRKDQPNIQG